MFPYVVADIGGTNARFAVVNGKFDEVYQLDAVRIYSGSEYASFEEVFAEYLASLSGMDIKYACLAIAGPITGKEISLTNLDWIFNVDELKSKFDFECIEVINDFAALASAMPELGTKSLIALKDGTTEKYANKAILGPGTGLGVAGLTYKNGKWYPLPGEGGHVNVSPATPLECDVIKAAIKIHGHVSAETLISGPGFVNLYNALAEVRGVCPDNLTPKQITGAALEKSDVLCQDTMALFCSLLGNFAGNLAVTLGAKGGVYLAGGILPRFVDYLRESDFVERFNDKGLMQHYVENIPVNLIVNEHAAFVGCAAWLEQQI